MGGGTYVDEEPWKGRYKSRHHHEHILSFPCHILLFQREKGSKIILVMRDLERFVHLKLYLADNYMFLSLKKRRPASEYLHEDAVVSGQPILKMENRFLFPFYYFIKFMTPHLSCYY